MSDLLAHLRAELLFAAAVLDDIGRPNNAKRLREAAAKAAEPCGQGGCSGHVDTLTCGECRCY
jgi:hypothetical protein